MSGSPRCRSDNDGPGPLTLASNACPDLRELEVGYWHLDQPPGPLAQLTRLSLTAVTAPPDGAPVLRSLVEAAPRLEVLPSWDEEPGCGIAAAVEGHPCLRELHLHRPQEDWMRAIPRLPALSDLELNVLSEWFEGEEMEADAQATARVLRVCAWLGHCKSLLHLNLTVPGIPPANEMLAAVGAAVGSRLRTLTIYNVQLFAQNREAAATTLYTLVVCFPQFEVLTLHLFAPDGMVASTAEAVARELLLAAPAVAPLCPALGEVKLHYCADGLQTATWLRSMV